MRYWKTVILASAIALTGACGNKETLPEAPEGTVKIEFLAPQVYGKALTRAVPGTKAYDGDDVLGDGNWHTLPDADIVAMDEGETLWISYSKLDENGEYGPPSLQAYRVDINAGGYNSLVSCPYEIGEDGLYHVTDDMIGAPLYLETGTYKFKMISPAYPIDPSMKMLVDNGMYLYSTDGRYYETSPEPMDIVINETGVQYIKLKPIISQVARFTFEIEKGDGVYELEPLQAGIEISGLQNTEPGISYNWCSEHIKDTLEMKYGDKRAMVTIPGDRIATGTDGIIRADIGVLPTFALPNSIAILLNLAVNGVPTQYMTLLNGMTLLHGHSYNIKWTVSLKDGQISVMTWQNQSWSTDLTPASASSADGNQRKRK